MPKVGVSWEVMAFDLRAMLRFLVSRAQRDGSSLTDDYFERVVVGWIGGYLTGLERAARRQKPPKGT